MRRLLLVLALFASAGCGALPLPFHRSPPPPAVVDVYLTDQVTAQQKQEIGATLQRTPGVQTVVFLSREQNYRRFKKLFKNKPELLKNVRPEALPASYRVRLTDRGKAQPVIAAVRGMPGVQSAKLQPTAQPS